MKKYILSFVCTFMILTNVLLASDIKVELSENAINSFVTATAPVTFEKEIKMLGQKQMADFTLKDMVVHLNKGEISLTGDLSLDMSGTKLDASVSGDLKPVLDPKTGVLSLKLDNINVVGLEFLKLDKMLKDKVSIPLQLTNLQPIKIKQSETTYKEIQPKIENENIVIDNKILTLTGDISFEKGEIKKY